MDEDNLVVSCILALALITLLATSVVLCRTFHWRELILLLLAQGTAHHNDDLSWLQDVPKKKAKVVEMPDGRIVVGIVDYV